MSTCTTFEIYITVEERIFLIFCFRLRVSTKIRPNREFYWRANQYRDSKIQL